MKRLLFALFLLCVSVVAIAAQTNPEQAARNARDQFSDIKNRSIELERMKRSANQPIVNSNPTRNFPEIKEDFEKIQKINSEILQPNLSKPEFNYSEISKSATEINRRAKRLRANLFPVASENRENVKNKKQPSAESSAVETLLKSLDQSIDSFVHNSIFQNTKLVDSADSQKAQNDLETLIKLSLQIKLKTMHIIKSGANN